MKFIKTLTITLILALGVAPVGSALAQTSDAQTSAATPTASDAGPVVTPLDEAGENPSDGVSGVGAVDAQGEPEKSDNAEQSPAELGSEMYTAVKAGKWIVAIGFALLLLVGVARKFGGRWAKTKLGGYALGFGVPIFGVLGLSLTTGQWSIDAFLGALAVGLSASGLLSGARDVKSAKDARAASASK